MSASEWIAKRRELLAAATEGPWSPEDVYGLVAPTKIDGYTHPVERAEAIRQGAADDALIADARTALPRALDALEAVLKEAWRIESGHHFHGIICICGYASHRARDRTEHLTRPLTDAIEAALRGDS